MKKQTLKIISITVTLLLLWMLTSYLLWIFQRENLIKTVDLTTSNDFMLLHIKSLILPIMVWMIFFLLPKRIYKNKRFELMMFMWTLLVMLLALMPWLWFILDNNLRLDIFNVIYIQPVYLYIIWSILVLSKAVSCCDVLIRRFPLFLKYNILQVIVSIPIIFFWNTIDIIILWGVWSIMFLNKNTKNIIKYLIFNIILAFWLFYLILTQVNPIKIDIVWCNNIYEQDVQIEKKSCYTKLSLKSIFPDTKTLMYGNQDWLLQKEIPDIGSTFTLAGLWERLWIVSRFVLIWLYTYLFFMLYKIKSIKNKKYLIIWLSSYLLLSLVISVLVNIGMLPFIDSNLLLIGYMNPAVMAQILAIVLIIKYSN